MKYTSVRLWLSYDSSIHWGPPIACHDMWNISILYRIICFQQDPYWIFIPKSRDLQNDPDKTGHGENSCSAQPFMNPHISISPRVNPKTEYAAQNQGFLKYCPHTLARLSSLQRRRSQPTQPHQTSYQYRHLHTLIRVSNQFHTWRHIVYLCSQGQIAVPRKPFLILPIKFPSTSISLWSLPSNIYTNDFVFCACCDVVYQVQVHRHTAHVYTYMHGMAIHLINMYVWIWKRASPLQRWMTILTSTQHTNNEREYA